MRRVRAVALLFAVTIGLAACGVPNQRAPVVIDDARLPPERPAAPSGPPTLARFTLYFVRNNQLVAVTRANNGVGLAGAIGSLLEGPTAPELAASMTTSIPDGTVLDASKLAGAVALLDFSKALASVSGQEQLFAFAQVVATATSVSGVQRVQISVGGQTVDAPRPDGTLAQGAVSRADYAGLLPS